MLGQKVVKRQLDKSQKSPPPKKSKTKPPPKKSKTKPNMTAYKDAEIKRLEDHIDRAKDFYAPRADIQKCQEMMVIAMGLLEKVCDDPNNRDALLKASQVEADLQKFVDGFEPSAEDCDGPEEEYPLYSDDE